MWEVLRCFPETTTDRVEFRTELYGPLQTFRNAYKLPDDQMITLDEACRLA
jgi:hypothetical protein